MRPLAFACVAASLFVGRFAAATPPAMPVSVSPLAVATPASGYAVDVHLEVDGIEELDVESRLYLAETLVSVVTTGATVVDPASRTEATTPHAIAAGKGARVPFELPRTFSLSPGLYAEYILVTVIVHDGLQPVDVSALRYFEVSESGVLPLDIDEYSRRVLATATLPNGGIGYSGGTVERPASVKHVVTGFDLAKPTQRAEVRP